MDIDSIYIKRCLNQISYINLDFKQPLLEQAAQWTA